MEFTIKSYENLFRIKKMNAIEVLALRSQIDFENFDKAFDAYMTILEKLEVKVADSWVPVKEKGKNIYFPMGIEDNLPAIEELLNTFTYKYYLPLFKKSAE